MPYEEKRWFSHNIRRALRGERILILVFVLTLPLVNPIIRGDGWGYFGHLHSIFIDGDLDYENEFARANPKFQECITAQGPSPTGRIANHFALGPAVLWLPAYYLVHLLMLLLKGLGVVTAADGFGKPYYYAVGLSTAVYSFVGLLLSLRIASRFTSFNSARAATVLIWFASSLPAYMYFHPSMSHGCSFFTVALLYYLWVRLLGKDNWWKWLLLGGALGLAVMTRYQNIVHAFPLLYEFILNPDARTWKPQVPNLRRLLTAPWAFLGFLVVFFPQMLVWKGIWGSYFTSGYESHFLFGWHAPHLLKVLFSTRHGFVTWTPILGLSLVGLVYMLIRRPLSTLPFFFPALVVIYLISCWYLWWQASSFGGRMFIEIYSIFILGLSWLIHRIFSPQRIWLAYIIGIPFIVWNMGLLFQFGVGMVSRTEEVSFREILCNWRKMPRLLWEFVRDFFGSREKVEELFYEAR